MRTEQRILARAARARASAAAAIKKAGHGSPAFSKLREKLTSPRLSSRLSSVRLLLVGFAVFLFHGFFFAFFLLCERAGATEAVANTAATSADRSLVMIFPFWLMTVVRRDRFGLGQRRLTSEGAAG